MTSTSSQSQSILYSPATIQRADRAARCTPFQLALFVAMQQHSVDLQAIAGQTGVQQGYTQTPVSELVAETALLWLIQVGMLRREVDGQGLTNSFRLTPLGRQLVQRWQALATLPSASVLDRVQNAVSRWLRLPAALK